MKATLATIVAIFTFTFVSCAPKQVRSPEGKVAYTGKAVLESVEDAQKALITLADNGTVPKEEAAKSMEVFKQIGEHGQKLADVLQAIDAATAETDTSSQFAEVRSRLNQIAQLLSSTLVPIGNLEARQQIAGLLSKVNETLLTVASEIAKDQQSTQTP